MNAPNPWEEHANAGVDEDGELRSGWLMKYSNLPANIDEELSETPYMTGRAIDFMDQAGDKPWLCHLSYIKPHWPYIVPAPYHDMYGKEHILPAVRSEEERAPTTRCSAPISARGSAGRSRATRCASA